MAKNGTLHYTFRGSSAQLKKIQDIIRKALARPPKDPGGPVEDWGQSGGWVQDVKDNWGQKGGWYLVVENKATKVARPDEAVTAVTASVYKALAKAKQRG